MAETKIERMKRLFDTYGLTKEDYFKHKFYTIITRSGIDRIQASADIEINYELLSSDINNVIIKAKAQMGDRYIETFGESNPKNTTNAYPIAMAEKRAMSRCVLKLTGFYELGGFGEDEADDFKRA